MNRPPGAEDGGREVGRAGSGVQRAGENFLSFYAVFYRGGMTEELMNRDSLSVIPYLNIDKVLFLVIK